jgi:uncharacterized membrane protein
LLDVRFKLRRFTTALRTNLWFVPLLLLLCGILLGLAIPGLDRAFDRTAIVRHALTRFRPGASGAMSLLATAANALTTVLAVGFSITMVTVQLSASQYTPRLLRSFMADSVTQRVLGAFLGTIGYLTLVLWSVQPAGERGIEAVPAIALLTALILTLSCLALVAVFLHHVTRSVQPATIIARVGKETIAAIWNLPESDPSCADAAPPEGPASRVEAQVTGYVQAIDEQRLAAMLPAGTQAMRIDARPGDFLFPGVELLSLWPEVPLSPQTAAALRSAFGTGRERTLEQDVLFGVRQLVDMALRALSPAINDVTTAFMVVNELGAIARQLLALPGITLPNRRWRAGGATLFTPSLSLEAYLDAAFGEVALFATGHHRVLARMLEILSELAEVDDEPAIRRELLRTGRELHRISVAHPTEGAYAGMVDDRWARLRATLRDVTPPEEQPAIQ